MLVRRKTGNDASIQTTNGGKSASPFWSEIQAWKIARNRTPLSNSYFSLGYPGTDLTGEPGVATADILHLHWLADFQSPPSIAALAALGKPMVWTLHDQRPFTGGCHFSAGCRGFESECFPCPQLRHDDFAIPRRNLRDQRELFAPAQFTVVAPSRWLADAARSSVVFKNARVEVIPYGIDTAQFFPVEKAAARQRLGLADDKFYVLFGADFASERRKGVTEFVEALSICRAAGDAPELLAFGELPADFTSRSGPCRALGYLRSAEQLRDAYAAADLFVLPSLEDNLPNTMLEALACGTAVLAFSAGGIPDVISDGLCGRLVPVGDSRALAAALRELIADPASCRAMGREGARLIAERHTLRDQAEHYAALYQSLSAPKSARVRPPAVGRHLRRALPRIALSLLWKNGLRHHWQILQKSRTPAT